MWRSYLYAMFGSLFAVMMLLVFVVSEISIISTYFALQAGNYNWQWRSFWIGASGGIFFGLYMDYYFFFIAGMDMFSAELIYYIWSLLICYSFIMVCGSISYAASYVFVTVIY